MGYCSPMYSGEHSFLPSFASGAHSKIGSFKVLWVPENSDKLVALTKKGYPYQDYLAAIINAFSYTLCSYCKRFFLF
jgi:hypothetical protein